MKKSWWLLIFMVLLCYGVATLGAIFTPGEWYEGLQRAPWSPPNYVFPIAWSILYACIAAAGWIIFSSEQIAAKILWAAQLSFNAAWSWLFFGQHWVALALIDVLLMAVSIGILIVICWRNNLSSAAWLLSPYLLWVCIATSLNAYVYLYN